MAGRTPFLVKASEKSTRSVMPGAPGEVAVCVCAGACVCVCVWVCDPDGIVGRGLVAAFSL